MVGESLQQRHRSYALLGTTLVQDRYDPWCSHVGRSAQMIHDMPPCTDFSTPEERGDCDAGPTRHLVIPLTTTSVLVSACVPRLVAPRCRRTPATPIVGVRHDAGRTFPSSHRAGAGCHPRPYRARPPCRGASSTRALCRLDRAEHTADRVIENPALLAPGLPMRTTRSPHEHRRNNRRQHEQHGPARGSVLVARF